MFLFLGSMAHGTGLMHDTTLWKEEAGKKNLMSAKGQNNKKMYVHKGKSLN